MGRLDETVSTIIVNDLAGRRGRSGRHRLARVLAENGHAVEVRRVDPDRLTRELERSIRRGDSVVGVGGGDGTLATAAAVAVGTRTAILPVPLGTLNHFAKRLGVHDVATALKTIGDPLIESVPVGILDDGVFLNTATFGAYADLVRRRDRLRPYLTRWPAAVVAFVRTLFELRPIEIVASVEGSQIRRRTALVWVGVGRGSFPLVTEGADWSRARDLEIVVLRPRTRLGSVALLARLAADLLRGKRPSRDSDIEVLHARSLLIVAPHRLGVTMDGEVSRVNAPLFLSIQDGALRVARPGRSLPS